MFNALKKFLKKIRNAIQKVSFYLFRYPRYRFFPVPLFEHINIQTTNRCTRQCSYCYYGTVKELPPFFLMPMDLFEKIINDLADLNFSGRISLYEINEPMTDNRIFDLLAFAKKKLPNAFHFLISNGDLLDKEKGEKLFASGLDELWINCYLKNDEPKNKALADYLNNRGYSAKIIRNYKAEAEDWDSRAGNVKNSRRGICAPCELVYKQIIVQPDGKVHSCVNDFYGKSVMGDLAKRTLKEIWFGEIYVTLRKKLIKGNRRINELCALCDYKGYGGFVSKTKK